MEAQASPQAQDTGIRPWLMSACEDSGEEFVRPRAPPKMERERSEASSCTGPSGAQPPIGPLSHHQIILSLQNRVGWGGEPLL